MEATVPKHLETSHEVHTTIVSLTKAGRTSSDIAEALGTYPARVRLMRLEIMREFGRDIFTPNKGEEIFSVKDVMNTIGIACTTISIACDSGLLRYLYKGIKPGDLVAGKSCKSVYLFNAQQIQEAERHFWWKKCEICNQEFRLTGPLQGRRSICYDPDCAKERNRRRAAARRRSAARRAVSD